MARWSLRSPLWPELLGGSFFCFSLRGEHGSSSMVPGSYFWSRLYASCLYFFLVPVAEKWTKGLAGAGVEVAEGWLFKGGGAVCGGRPRDFLPLPLLLFFLSVPVAEDTALVGLPPRGFLALEVVGLTKGPHFLRIFCCQTSRADTNFPYPLVIQLFFNF